MVIGLVPDFEHKNLLATVYPTIDPSDDDSRWKKTSFTHRVLLVCRDQSIRYKKNFGRIEILNPEL